MAMTAQEKTVHKLATSLRSKAYYARLKEKSTLREALLEEVQQSPEQQAFNSADASFTEQLRARDRELAEIDEQIAQLQAQREMAAKKHADSLAESREVRNHALSVCPRMEEVVREKVDQQFPDLAGVFGPGAWKTLQPFLEEAQIQSQLKP